MLVACTKGEDFLCFVFFFSSLYIYCFIGSIRDPHAALMLKLQLLLWEVGLLQGCRIFYSVGPCRCAAALIIGSQLNATYTDKIRCSSWGKMCKHYELDSRWRKDFRKSPFSFRSKASNFISRLRALNGKDIPSMSGLVQHPIRNRNFRMSNY